MSAPHSPPVPARRNEIRATGNSSSVCFSSVEDFCYKGVNLSTAYFCVLEEKKTVIRELSALRRQLRSEQRRLEGQLMPPRNDNPSAVSSRYIYKRMKRWRCTAEIMSSHYGFKMGDLLCTEQGKRAPSWGCVRDGKITQTGAYQKTGFTHYCGCQHAELTRV